MVAGWYVTQNLNDSVEAEFKKKSNKWKTHTALKQELHLKKIKK